MIPMMLQQGYKCLAVTFDVWGMANMVKNGMDEARAVIEKDVAAATKNGTAKEANGSKASNDGANGAVEVVNGRAPPS
jgi:4-hydroxy-2-oxoheptanedioate aldolase